MDREGCDLLEPIGSGGYATVYKILKRNYDTIFALKVIKFDQSQAGKTPKACCNEAKNLEKINHPNIINIYKYFYDEMYMYMVLEYCPNGSLKDLVEQKGGLRKNEFVQIARSILEAINYLHKHNISHGDIKPANILFDSYNRPKLGDFGLAEYREGVKKLKRNYTCSPFFAAPEILCQMPYDPYKTDMWAYGITCFYMREGRLPVDHCSNVKEIISKIENPMSRFSQYYDLSIILDATLTMNPMNRVSAKELLSYPLFDDMKNRMPVFKTKSFVLEKSSNMNNFKPIKNSSKSTSTVHNLAFGILGASSINLLQGHSKLTAFKTPHNHNEELETFKSC